MLSISGKVIISFAFLIAGRICVMLQQLARASSIGMRSSSCLSSGSPYQDSIGIALSGCKAYDTGEFYLDITSIIITSFKSLDSLDKFFTKFPY